MTETLNPPIYAAPDAATLCAQRKLLDQRLGADNARAEIARCKSEWACQMGNHSFWQNLADTARDALALQSALAAPDPHDIEAPR